MLVKLPTINLPRDRQHIAYLDALHKIDPSFLKIEEEVLLNPGESLIIKTRYRCNSNPGFVMGLKIKRELRGILEIEGGGIIDIGSFHGEHLTYVVNNISNLKVHIHRGNFLCVAYFRYAYPPSGFYSHDIKPMSERTVIEKICNCHECSGRDHDGVMISTSTLRSPVPYPTNNGLIDVLASRVTDMPPVDSPQNIEPAPIEDPAS